jgi:hypothetical protein
MHGRSSSINLLFHPSGEEIQDNRQYDAYDEHRGEREKDGRILPGQDDIAGKMTEIRKESSCEQKQEAGQYEDNSKDNESSCDGIHCSASSGAGKFNCHCSGLSGGGVFPR